MKIILREETDWQKELKKAKRSFWYWKEYIWLTILYWIYGRSEK